MTTRERWVKVMHFQPVDRIPHVDHRCSPDVRYEDYLYYLDLKKELLLKP